MQEREVNEREDLGVKQRLSRQRQTLASSGRDGDKRRQTARGARTRESARSGQPSHKGDGEPRTRERPRATAGRNAPPARSDANRGAERRGEGLADENASGPARKKNAKEKDAKRTES